MKTFPVIMSPDETRLLAFEVDHIYISLSAISYLLLEAAEVVDVKRRRAFSSSSEDVHIQFKYHGYPCIVWEPYGDSSRYWIGPVNTETFTHDMSAIENIFRKYQPPIYRKIIGDLLSLKF